MRKAVVVFALLAVLSVHALAGISLGEAGNYAVLGLQNATVTLSHTHSRVNGDVGVASGGKLDFEKGIINGDLYLDAGASVLDYNGTLTGTRYNSQNLSQAVLDAQKASNDAAALTATQTFGTITNSQTITGNGGQNVINITNLTLGSGGKTLTLSGGASDVFILNVSNSFSMGNTAAILLAGGMDASRVLINVLGSVGSLNNQVIINGTILAYNESIYVRGTLNGSVIAGTVTISDSDLTIYDATVNGVAFVPEPATLVILSIGSTLVFGRRKKM